MSPFEKALLDTIGDMASTMYEAADLLDSETDPDLLALAGLLRKGASTAATAVLELRSLS